MNPFEESKIPHLDQLSYTDIQTATLAMGCFWSPEALFGAMKGVIRTRVGFAGGTTPAPTYRTLADHIETVQIEFDPEQVTFAQLLEKFFAKHTPTQEPRKRQYTSAIFYHSPEQEQGAQDAIKAAEEQFQAKVLTELIPYENFHLAEERHQKWKLRRHTEVLRELQKIYPAYEAFNNSTAVARVNGYVGGYGEQETLMEEIASLGLSVPVQNTLLALYMTQGTPGFPFAYR
ncbi:peptide-methionine (S)-S-oxide reductase MsrA [Rufibacter hautae]|uniref:Peptide methionine sulfoxide reductase MsrA n=1 Tax=Rufibacter hautae TaxID=2595005 RepID=A0A5B6TET7_9BACT|nr:peptide-methionine (S)-S-oxide reductase MsrA [Rufibacter hautae]KAA3437805.1 peptide-methionine (S)-S-oxide reductase MsrA [Rufibacter hautae]